MSEKIVLNFKLIFIGDSSNFQLILDTGKTAILNQYIYHTFTNTKATTGIDFFTKMFEIDDFIVKLNIFDTAGQQRYLSMTKSYFRGTNAALFTYSLAEKQSFINLPIWIKKFEQQAGHETLKVVVGTKSDLKPSKLQKTGKTKNFPQKLNKDEITKENKQAQKVKENKQVESKVLKAQSENEVTPTEIEELLKNHQITFAFQTSAFLNQNIDEVFQEICKFLILKQMNKKDVKHENLNRSRVQTQFSKSKHLQNEDEKLSLEQRKQGQKVQHKSCC